MSLNANLNTVYINAGGGALRALSGWTGLENCGNLLTYKMDVGNNTNTLYGMSLAFPYGLIEPTTIAGLDIFRFSVDTFTGRVILALGNGGTQIPGVNTVVLTFQGFGDITLTWNGNGAASDVYSLPDEDAVGRPLTDYIASLDGQRVSFDVDQPVLLNVVDNGLLVVHNTVQVIFWS